MWTVVLGASAAVLALLAAGLLVAWMGARRRLVQLTQECEQHRQAEQQACQRLERRGQQADRLSGQLEKSREENARLRKKAHELEQKLRAQRERQPGDDEAPAKSRTAEPDQDRLAQLEKQLARGEQQREQLEARIEKLRGELEQARQKLQAGHQQAVRQRASEGEKLERLEKEVGELKKKLSSARRKARNDEQVYRVTKSKLELALEKIAALEKALQEQAGGSAAGPGPATPPDAAEPAGSGG